MEQNNYIHSCNCDKLFGEFPCPIHEPPVSSWVTVNTSDSENKDRIMGWRKDKEFKVYGIKGKRADKEKRDTQILLGLIEAANSEFMKKVNKLIIDKYGE